MTRSCANAESIGDTEPQPTGGVPSAAFVERAGALFREAREAIDAFEPNSVTHPYAPRTKVAIQAMLPKNDLLDSAATIDGATCPLD